MVNQINPNVNVYFAYRAINYLGGEAENEDFSVLGSAKSAVNSLPLGLAVTQIPRALEYRKSLFRKAAATQGPGVIAGYKNLFKAADNAKTGMIGQRGIMNLGKNIATGLQDFEVVDKLANASRYAPKAVKTGIFSRIKGAIAKPFQSVIGSIGAIKIGGKTLATTALGKGLGKLGALCKKGNAGAMALFDGAIELFTQVAPAFKNGGFSEGMKQLGKSALKVGATTLGFIAGEAGGKAIGAAIGTAICPGVGTLIGGFLGGLVGGIFGSSIAGGIAKKVTGKSYSEEVAETQKQEQAQLIAQDPAAMNELKQATLQILLEKQQKTGKLTKEEQAMLEQLTGNGQFTDTTIPTTSFRGSATPPDYSTPEFRAQNNFYAIA